MVGINIKSNAMIKSLLVLILMVFVSTGSVKVAEAQTTNYFVNVKDFGAKGDGVTDDTAAIQAAIDSLYVNDLGGGTVFFPPGRYIINGVNSGDTYRGQAMKNGVYLRNENPTIFGPTDKSGRNNRVTLRGAGKASVLQGNSNNLIVVRLSTGYATIKDLAIDGGTTYGNFSSNVVGLALVPENMQDQSEHSKTSFNAIENVHISNTYEGILLMCGPENGGSACYWNSFTNISMDHMVRGVFFLSGPEGGPSTNRNHWENIGMSFMNVGMHIESGDTNTCVHCAMTDINLQESPYNGLTPRQVPTALVIEATDKWEIWGNTKNRFYNLHFEDNTRNIENSATRQEFYGVNDEPSKNVWNQEPAVFTGSSGHFFESPGVYVGKDDMTGDSKVALGLYSDNQGFLPPRMTTSQRDAMGSVPEGLMIYNTTTKNLNVFSSGSWKAMTTN